MKKNLYRRLNTALEDRKTADFRHHVFALRRPRVDAFRISHPESQARLRQIKRDSLSSLDDLVAQAAERMKSNGFLVFMAGSPGEALNYIDAVIGKGPVVKSKSNAAKEINLAAHLGRRGIEVVETDLGDRICQLGNFRPAHPLGPAAHLPVERVAEILSAHAGEKLSPDPMELVRWARISLRDILLRAGTAITGANAIAADTGSVVLTENEGNIRMAVSVPSVLVVVAGIEKVVPTLEDCLDVVKCTAGFGVGQDIGTYVSVVSGVAGDQDSPFSPRGPLEVHVILLAEGRRKIMGTPLEEILQCVNCGHCLRVCPVFCELGEEYGSPYFGGIGVLKVAARGDLDGAYLSGLDLCLGCRRCISACPAGISTPDLIAFVRRQRVAENGLGGVKKQLIGSLKDLSPVKRGVLYQVQRLYGVKLGRFRKTRVKLMGRDIVPDLAQKPLHLALKTGAGDIQGNNRVIYFPGCLHNLFFVDAGAAAVDLLKKTGSRVVLPPGQMCCGYPAAAAGDRDSAREMAQRNLAFFRDQGCPPVVVDCPTCRTGIGEYPRLFEGAAGDWPDLSREMAEKLQSLSSFLSARLDRLGPLELPGLAVTYHRPCHLDDRGARADEEILSGIGGITLRQSGDAACCGFGGLFSLEFHSVSKIISRRRLKGLLEPGPNIIVTSCPGCMYHLSEGLYRQGGGAVAIEMTDLIKMSVVNTGGEYYGD